jgi:CDP-glucose 4,6-dehydratase
VLVTGADGLLGGWLARALVAGGHRVVAIRREGSAASTLQLLGAAAEVQTVRGDICEEGLVAHTLSEHGVSSVFHLAAQSVVATASRAPRATFETNVRGTWMLLEACRERAVGSVVVASSYRAYGPQRELPYRETQPLQPASPYDASKAGAELIACSYWPTFGLPVAVTRFANVYGGGDTNRSRLVPEAVAAALSGRAPVIRSDGSPERDFLYVEDAVAAYLAIWRALLQGRGAGEAYNAGGGRPHRVRDVVDLICRLAGGGLAPQILGGGTPDGESDRQWVDATKLAQLTGWTPSVGLKDGLRRTIAWYRAHPHALGLGGREI